MKKRLTAGLAVAMAMVMMSACGGKTAAPADAPKETQAAAADSGKGEKAEKAESTEAAAELPAWPFTDKEITFYTRNNAGAPTPLAQQYLIDVVFKDGGTNLLLSDPTSGGAVCIDKTYEAGGDGYTFYVSGSEMVIGDVLGSFDHSLKNDFQVLGMVPSNGAPNFLSVSKSTLPDVDSVDSLVEYCKAHPGEVRFAYAPDTLGEVYSQLFVDHFGLDVKMTISEGNDSKPNLMGGIVDVVCWNQNNTIEYADYLTPLAALSNEPSTRDELKDVPTYKDLDMSDCVVPSVMFLVCKNDIDENLAQAINQKWNAAIEDVLSDNPSEEGKILKEHMASQDQTLEPLSIDECWKIIDDEYDKIGAVLTK